MKKLIFTILIATLLSCTPDDVCGTVTDWGVDENGAYLDVDGSQNYVDDETFFAYNIGDYVCIEY